MYTIVYISLAIRQMIGTCSPHHSTGGAPPAPPPPPKPLHACHVPFQIEVWFPAHSWFWAQLGGGGGSDPTLAKPLLGAACYGEGRKRGGGGGGGVLSPTEVPPRNPLTTPHLLIMVNKGTENVMERATLHHMHAATSVIIPCYTHVRWSAPHEVVWPLQQ